MVLLRYFLQLGTLAAGVTEEGKEGGLLWEQGIWSLAGQEEVVNSNEYVVVIVIVDAAAVLEVEWIGKQHLFGEERLVTPSVVVEHRSCW